MTTQRVFYDYVECAVAVNSDTYNPRRVAEATLAYVWLASTS